MLLMLNIVRLFVRPSLGIVLLGKISQEAAHGPDRAGHRQGTHA